MRSSRVVALLLAAFGMAGTGGAALGQEAVAATKPLRVLFVGNSLTYENDLPAWVEAISRRGAAEAALEAEVVTLPGASLEDHWGQGEALRAIDRGGWDFVVLQQGPSSMMESRSNLVYWSKRFAERIRAAGARPALYTVWPAETRPADFPGVIGSYAAAARAVDGLLLPAGVAWREARKIDRKIALYGADRFHPSPLGTALAAMVIEAALTGRPPVAEPSLLPPMDAAQALVLSRAASAALSQR